LEQINVVLLEPQLVPISYKTLSWVENRAILMGQRCISVAVHMPTFHKALGWTLNKQTNNNNPPPPPTATLAPESVWVIISPHGLFSTQSPHCDAMCHEALTRGQIEGANRFWTFSLQNCQLKVSLPYKGLIFRYFGMSKRKWTKTMRYHFTPTSMTIDYNNNNNNWQKRNWHPHTMLLGLSNGTGTLKKPGSSSKG
jgi:hypothetical protein